MSQKNEINIDTEEEPAGEMSFIDHLEELRWRIIYALAGIVVGAIICGIFIDFLVEVILLGPAINIGMKLQNLQPFGQLALYFQVALISGFIISIPNVFYQLWKFISPALRQHEKKYIFLIVVYTSFCFLAGVAFAYMVMLPLTLNFAKSFGTQFIDNSFSIDEYVSIIYSMMLGAGVVFELPMVSFFLAKLGILKPSFMRKYRKHAIVFIMIASAFLSPGTDPVSQMVLAVPLILLYEISIFITKISQKKT